MKCVKMGDVVERVADQEAVKRVGSGWSYAKKAEYKKAHPGKAKQAPKAVEGDVEEPVAGKKARWEKAKRKKDKADDAVLEVVRAK